MGFAIQPSPEIWHRDDFPILCNWRKLWRMVEVGVDRGEYAQMFLSRWQGEQYWGVDAYEPFPEQNFPREADYITAINRLARHAGRTKLIRLPSVEAAKLFPLSSVDFVYIDAAHDYESVRADIEAWTRPLSRWGILAGHDYDGHELHKGVKRAVNEFAAEVDQTVYLTAVKGYNQESEPSWYIYPYGMPGAEWRRC